MIPLKKTGLVLTLCVSFLLLFALSGCSNPDEKKAVETVNTYLEGFKELDLKKFKQTASQSTFDLSQNDEQLKEILKKRQEELGRVDKWRIENVTIDTVNGQSLLTLYVYTDREIMKATFDLRKNGGEEWRVHYVKVLQHIGWTDWPRSLGRLLLRHLY